MYCFILTILDTRMPTEFHHSWNWFSSVLSLPGMLYACDAQGVTLGKGIIILWEPVLSSEQLSKDLMHVGRINDGF